MAVNAHDPRGTLECLPEAFAPEARHLCVAPLAGEREPPLAGPLVVCLVTRAVMFALALHLELQVRDVVNLNVRDYRSHYASLGSVQP